MHTPKSITALLYRNPNAVRRGLIVLYERQTADEREDKNTKHLNKRGFNYFDAKSGTDLAKKVLADQPFTFDEMIAARSMILKYAGQLARVANGEVNAY